MTKKSHQFFSIFAARVAIGIFFIPSFAGLRADTLLPATAEEIIALTDTFAQNQEQITQIVGDSDLTLAALTFWTQQNSNLLSLQLQTAQVLAADNQFQPLSYVSEVKIPEEASQSLEDFLVTQATLQNAFSQIHNGLIGEYSRSIEEAATMAAFEATLYQQENSSLTVAQIARAKELSEEVAHQQVELPPPLIIPDQLSTRLQSYLQLQDQIDRAEAQIHNDYCAGDLNQMEAMLQQWQQQNSSLIAQFRSLAESLTPQELQQL